MLPRIYKSPVLEKNTIENPEESTKKLLALTDEFGKVAGYMINIQKSVVFLDTDSELSEREIKNGI